MANNRVISAVLTLRDRDFSSNARRAGSATREMEQKLKHAKNTVTRFGKSAATSFKSVATNAAGLVGAIGIVKGFSYAVGMVKSSITNAFDRIDVMENFERTMTVLTGSTDKAKAALESARQAVTGTAYGLDVAAKGVQDFVTRGMDVEKATSTMVAWGDAVAFYGDGSNEQLATVSDALAKMYSTGKVSMDQMNRLYDAGIDGVGMYAKAVGRDTGSVQKDLSKGKISTTQFLDVVNKAMMEGTNGVQKIQGAAKEAGASWSGSFANMRAAVTRGTTGIIQSIDKMLTDKGLPDMRSMVAQFGGKFEEVLGKAAVAVPVLGDALMKVYDYTKPGLDWIKDTAIPGIRDKLVGAYEAAQPGLTWLKDEALPGVTDAIGFVVEKAKDFYGYVTDNWSLIGPVVAGVAATIATLKVGIIAITAAKATWAAVTSGVQIATALLNGTLAISPLGWVALAIGAVVTAGILLWKNWDTVKAAAQSLWDKTKEVGGGIRDAFESAWSAVKEAAGNGINFMIDKINGLIKAINKIPGVNVPIIAKVDWSAAETAAPKGKVAGGSVMASYDVGTNRVERDQVAKIHKDEMIVPAIQARNLRRQGVTIDNIDKARPQRMMSVQTTGATSQDGLLKMIADLIASIKNIPQGETHIHVNGTNMTVTEIINELIPLLKLRLANL